MAWVIGIANKDEIKAIKKAGYTVETEIDIKGIDAFAKTEDGEIGVAIFVDCDIPHLLLVAR